MGVKDWELIGWNENSNREGNIAFSLSSTQIKIIFKTLGIKIIEDEEGTHIQHYSDEYLQRKLGEDSQ